MAPGLSDSRTTGAVIVIEPSSSSSTSSTRPVPRTWASSNRSSRSRTGAAGTPASARAASHSALVRSRKRGCEHLHQLRSALDARRAVVPRRRVEQARQPEGVAEAVREALGVGRDGEPPVGRAIGAVEGARERRQPRAREILDTHEGMRVQRDGRAQDGGLHPLPGPRAPALEERREDPRAGQQRQRRVVDGDRTRRRRIVSGGHARRHEAAQRLGEDVVSDAPTPRAVGAEGRDGAVDQARVPATALLPAEPEALRHTGAHVRHQDVGPLHEVVQHGPRLPPPEVQAERPLVAVGLDVVTAATGVSGHAFVLAPFVARGPLQLDRLGAHVGQVHRRQRPGQVVADVQDLHPGERPLGVGARMRTHGAIIGAASVQARPVRLSPAAVRSIRGPCRAPR